MTAVTIVVMVMSRVYLYKPKQEIENTNPKHQFPHIPRNPPKNQYQEQDVHAVLTASLRFHSAVWSLDNGCFVASHTCRAQTFTLYVL